MINLKLTPDKRRRKKDNTYPLIFRINYKGETRDIKTGYSAKESDWSTKTGFIKDSHPFYNVVAPRINELRLQYLSKLAEYEKANPRINLQEAKDFIICLPKKQVTVYSFWETEIEQLYKANRNGGAQIYKEALIAVNKVKSLKIPFEKLDYNFVKEVETDFLNRGVKQNTIGIHYRALRAIFNKAINAKVVSYEYYPFRSFRIKKGVTIPRNISLEEMKRYFNLNIDKTSNLYDSWLLGQLIFMLIGINFKDLVMLTEADLRADRVFYKRAKTKKLYSIKLLPKAQEIINYFRKEENPTLLGKLSKEEIENKTRFTLLIRQKNKTFNKHLAKLSAMVGCKEKITGYVFRYTWANIAKQLGYSKDLIAEALGHDYGNRVTGIYLQGYDLELVDEMNKSILDAIIT